MTMTIIILVVIGFTLGALISTLFHTISIKIACKLLSVVTVTQMAPIHAQIVTIESLTFICRQQRKPAHLCQFFPIVQLVTFSLPVKKLKYSSMPPLLEYFLLLVPTQFTNLKL